MPDDSETSLTPEQLIGRSKIFEGLSAADLQWIRELAHYREVGRNGYYFHQGDSAAAFYILVRGEVKLTHVTPDGHQVIVRLVDPGGSYGVTATLSHSEYEISAQVITDSTAFGWTARGAEAIKKQCPALTNNALGLVVVHYEHLLQQYHDLVTQRVACRLARVVLHLGRQVGREVEDGVLIDLPLSRQDLAEMAGTNIFNASRILSSWERKGLVEAGRERVLIRFPDGLKAISEGQDPESLPDSLASPEN